MWGGGVGSVGESLLDEVCDGCHVLWLCNWRAVCRWVELHSGITARDPRAFSESRQIRAGHSFAERVDACPLLHGQWAVGHTKPQPAANVGSQCPAPDVIEAQGMPRESASIHFSMEPCVTSKHSPAHD